MEHPRLYLNVTLYQVLIYLRGGLRTVKKCPGENTLLTFLVRTVIVIYNIKLQGFILQHETLKLTNYASAQFDNFGLFYQIY